MSRGPRDAWIVACEPSGHRPRVGRRILSPRNARTKTPRFIELNREGSALASQPHRITSSFTMAVVSKLRPKITYREEKETTIVTGISTGKKNSIRLALQRLP